MSDTKVLSLFLLTIFMDALYMNLDDDKTQNVRQFVPYKATSYVAKGPVGEKRVVT